MMHAEQLMFPHLLHLDIFILSCRINCTVMLCKHADFSQFIFQKIAKNIIKTWPTGHSKGDLCKPVLKLVPLQSFLKILLQVLI